jgi:protein MpaA
LIAILAAAMAAALAGGHSTTSEPAAREPPIARLEAAVAPRRPVVRTAIVTLGRSVEGRPIRAVARNGIGDARGGDASGPLVLAFGCVHGDECAGIRALRSAERGCPPYGDGLVLVPNLNPDGRAAGTRTNADGVDLNRNFAADWRAIGVPGDPQYSGPRPFSEPETRVARRLIRALRPDVTIWFHQESERLVRAWGPSIPVARRYARLSGEPFFRMPWLDGTAPNWQNHRFAGTTSFVVELPSAGPVDADRHGRAIFELAGKLLRGSDG